MPRNRQALHDRSSDAVEQPVISTTLDITCATPGGIPRRPFITLSSLSSAGTEPKVLTGTRRHPKRNAYPSRKPNGGFGLRDLTDRVSRPAR